jgi:hypothetical protein
LLADVESLLDINATDAEELMVSLSRNQKTRSVSLLSLRAYIPHSLINLSTIVNAVVILAAMIIIVEPSAATVEIRKKTLFSIMDFNGLGQISLDEMVSQSDCLHSLIDDLISLIGNFIILCLDGKCLHHWPQI